MAHKFLQRYSIHLWDHGLLSLSRRIMRYASVLTLRSTIWQTTGSGCARFALHHPCDLRKSILWGPPCYEDDSISSCWSRVTWMTSSRFARDQRSSVGEKVLGYPSSLLTGKGFLHKLCPKYPREHTQWTIIYGPTIARLNFACGTPVCTVSDVSHRVY
jgi:hypothetical protein